MEDVDGDTAFQRWKNAGGRLGRRDNLTYPYFIKGYAVIKFNPRAAALIFCVVAIIVWYIRGVDQSFKPSGAAVEAQATLSVLQTQSARQMQMKLTPFPTVPIIP